MQPNGDILIRFWTLMAQHLWQTTVVLAIVWAVSLAMRRAPARFLNSLLWIGLAKFFVPMAMLGALGRSVLSSVRSVAETLGLFVGVPAPFAESVSFVLNPRTLNGGASGGPPSGGIALVLVTAIWIGGALALALAGWKKRSAAAPATDFTLEDAHVRVRDRTLEAICGTSVPPDRVRITRQSLMPFVAGALRPRIVLPESVVLELETAELQGILLHEDAHRRRREPARALVTRAAALAFFFYPPLWPLLRRLRETGEMACDDAALERGVEPAVYAGALARTLELGLGLAPSSAALDRRSPALIRQRLRRISQPWRQRMLTKHRAVLALTVLVVVLLSAISAVSGPEEDAGKDVDKPVETKIKLVKKVPPKYPEMALEKGLEAVVLVEITIGEDLKVTDATVKAVVVSSEPIDMVKFKKDTKAELYPPDNEEHAEYHEVFGEAAVEAALQWAIAVEPGSAELVSRTLMVPLQFKLDGEGKEKGEEKGEEEAREKVKRK